MKPKLLRAERKRRGWSQADVAEALGITTKTVTRWELGVAVPFPYHRNKLSDLFGKTVQELGLLQDADENDTLKHADSPVVPSSMSNVPVQAPFLADPTIPVHLKSGDTLYRRNGLLTLMKESLFAVDTVFLTASGGLPSIGQTALALSVATDRQVQAHFRHGILWAKLGPHPNVLGILARWGKLLGIASSQVEDFHSRQAWGRALRAAIGARQMLLVIGNAYRAEDALALQVGGTACTHLLTTGLSQVAFAFAQQGAIVISQLEGGDRIALLHHVLPQLVEAGDSGFTSLQAATLP